MGFLVAPFKLFLMRSCTVASRTSTLKFETKEMSFVPRERNFLVLEPGSFSLKGNVASYIDRPEHVSFSFGLNAELSVCQERCHLLRHQRQWLTLWTHGYTGTEELGSSQFSG